MTSSSVATTDEHRDLHPHRPRLCKRDREEDPAVSPRTDCCNADVERSSGSATATKSAKASAYASEPRTLIARTVS